MARFTIVEAHLRKGKHVREHVRKIPNGKKGFISKEAAHDHQIKQLQIKAKASGAEIDSIGKEFANKYNGVVTPINYKSFGSIKRKLINEEGGFIENIKDSVRNTVIIPPEQFNQLQEKLKKDKRFTRVKYQDPDKYNGYKGIITNIKTKNGINGEIQFNTAAMIYAKEPPKISKMLIGAKEFNRIYKISGKKGGLGHKMYEEIRKLNAKRRNHTITPNELEKMKKLIKQQKEYYKTFHEL